MPNDVDADRLGAKLQDAKVVNLEDYRSKGADAARTFSSSYLTPQTSQFLTVALVVVFFLIILHFFKRGA